VARLRHHRRSGTPVLLDRRRVRRPRRRGRLAVGPGLAAEAEFGPDAIAFGNSRLPYAEITEVRRGAVSAKPFWLAFWLPTSLLVGLIVALRSSSEFDREVVELGTGRGRVRARWRDFRAADAFVAAVREKRPDLQTGYGVVPDTFARDYSPRLSVGGGFLAFGLGLWLFLGGWFGCSCWTSRSTPRTTISTSSSPPAASPTTPCRDCATTSQNWPRPWECAEPERRSGTGLGAWPPPATT
jgi:hypothetical protein